MKVAMFIVDEKMKRMHVEAMRALVFNLENEKIIGMEDYTIYNMEINYISTWLLEKQVKEVYIKGTENNSLNNLNAVDISVKKFEEIDERHVFNAFIV